MPYRLAIPEVYSTREFAALKSISGSRLRQLTRQGRVYPYKKNARGEYIYFGNTVIIRPALRPGKRLAKSPTDEDIDEAAARVLRRIITVLPK